MNNSKTKRIIIYLSAYILFLAMGFTFLVLYLNFRQIEGNKDYINREHSLVTNTLERTLESDYQTFIQIVDKSIESNPLDTLQKLNTVYNEIRIHPTKFYLEEENGLRVNANILYEFSTRYKLDKDKYYNSNVTVIRANEVFINKALEDGAFFLFRYNNFVALLDIESYLSSFVQFFENATNGFIVANDGFVYYDRNDDTKNFSSVIKDSNIIKELFKDSTFTYRLKEDSKNILLISSSPIKGESELFINAYAIHFYNEEDINVITKNVYDVAIIFITIAMLIIIGAQMLIYKSLAIKNADIETSRLNYYYKKPLIVFLRKNGTIKGFNRAFKKTVVNYKDFKSFDDFLISDEMILSDNMHLLHKQNPFDCHIRYQGLETTIRFIPIKKINGYDLIGEDITKQDIHFSEYKSLALYHQTTNLPNLSYFKINIREKMSNKEYMKNKHSIILINISNFRNINRILGEETADLVLNNFAAFLNSQKTSGMDLYNTFMDYFLICFNNVNDFKDVRSWFDELLISLEKPLDVDASKINLKIKAGIYNYDGKIDTNLEDSHALYQRALSALNQARHSDKNVVIYDDSIGQNVEYQKQMEADLRKAIDNDEFVLYLQPQYDIEKEKIVAFEALIRWNNPKYINVSPQVYIQLAEANNLIIEIGEIVIRKTFELVKKLEKYNVIISMNISPVQVLQAGFINDFLKLYDEYQIKKHSVAIEITETFLMSSFDLVVDKLKILKEAGVDIHLDDFGTGNSSLLYLQELPIDTIKIDRGFIMHLPQDKYSKAIINMIVALAKNLDLDIIAEGIETTAQSQFLYKSGLNVIQGWLISRARPIDEIIDLLENPDKIKVEGIKPQAKRRK